MIDFYATQVRGHRRNIERYCRLLATDLTEVFVVSVLERGPDGQLR